MNSILSLFFRKKNIIQANTVQSCFLFSRRKMERERLIIFERCYHRSLPRQAEMNFEGINLWLKSSSSSFQLSERFIQMTSLHQLERGRV